MTREEVINGLKVVRTIHNGNYAPQIDEAIKVLEQEHILDKIRAEIKSAYCKAENDYDKGRNYGLHMAIQIIDDYTEE